MRRTNSFNPESILVCLCLYRIITECTAKSSVNVARGTRTSQSSTFFSTVLNQSLSASLAVDDNSDVNIYGGSCMLTAASDTQPWMAIDLGRPTTVTGVEVSNILIGCDTTASSSVGGNNLLYPFGLEVGDSSGPFLDCNNGFAATPLIVNPAFNFFNTSQSVIYISTNGLISFGYGNNVYSPYAIPSRYESVAVFKAKTSFACGTQMNSVGNVFYRVSTDAQLLIRATKQIQRSFSASALYTFQPDYLVIVTWSEVTYFNGNSSTPKNTFQAVLVSDGTYSFVLMNYGLLTWSAGQSSPDISRTAAVMGIDSGDGIHYYMHPWSLTNTIVNLTQSSNVGVNGIFAFRVDSTNVQLPDCPTPQPWVFPTTAFSLLYPYGRSVGDVNNTVSDCNNGYTSKIAMLPGLTFYNKLHINIQISVNGWLGFNYLNGDYTPSASEFPSSTTRIAVYWADVDLCSTGYMFYRITYDSSILSRAVQDIKLSFVSSDLYSYQPTWALIVTWDSVPFRETTLKITNTFQAVVVTDGLTSFAIFNYDKLTWTTGTWSYGDSQGLGGTPAAVGFNAGDGKRSYLHPWSFTSDILKLSKSSNVGMNGRWIYRLDGLNLLQPNYNVPGSSASSSASLAATTQSPLFYPAGAEVTSLAADCNNYCTTPITLTPGFPFLNRIQTQLSINNNGQLSFGYTSRSYCPESIPSGYARIAVYWNDIYDTCGPYKIGSLSYSYTSDDATLARMMRDVQLAFQSTEVFTPQWVLSVTWTGVVPLGSIQVQRNSFQVVMTTDGVKTFVMLNFQQLQWSSSLSFCSLQAEVAFDAGDSWTYYKHQWSKLPSIVNLTISSNAGLPGRWFYRVDGRSVQTPNNPSITGVVASAAGSANNIQLMYPFGYSAGDVIPSFSSCSGGHTSNPISVSPSFPFFNYVARTRIEITVDGFLTFDDYKLANCPSGAPAFVSNSAFIAAYINDIYPAFDSCTGAGKIWSRYTSDSLTLSRLASDIQQYFTNQEIQYFNPVWAVIITWDGVSADSGSTSLQNTFQVVLTTDGEMTFVFMNYAQLQWAKAQGCSTPARVGLGAGDSRNFFALPWSETTTIFNLATSSNCGLNGRWVYRVDGDNILQPNQPSFNAPLQSLLQVSTLVTSSAMYPYGFAAGDTTGTCSDCDNGWVEFNPSTGIRYFGLVRYTIGVNFNGHIMMDSPSTYYGSYTPPSDRVQISAFCSDLYWTRKKNNGIGDMFIRLSTNVTELAMAANDIKRYFTYPGLDQFTPTWILVATWSQVTFYSGSNAQTQPTNTFQIVLVTDGDTSFAMLNYEKVTWTSSTSTGFGGTAATVAFDGGNSWSYYSHPFSQSANVLNLTKSSNCGINGRWVYRIDQINVQLPNQYDIVAAMSSSPSTAGNSAAASTTPQPPVVTNQPVNTTIPFIVGLTNIDPTTTTPLLYKYTLCNLTWQSTNQLYPVGLASDGSVVSVQCPVGLPRYRYVIIQLPTKDTLAICDVKVFSSDYAWRQHAGSKLGYGVYQNLTVDFKTMCMRSCMTDNNCDSVNYSPSNMNCQLIKQYNAMIVNSTDLVADSSWEWWSNQYTDWNR